MRTRWMLAVVAAAGLLVGAAGCGDDGGSPLVEGVTDDGGDQLGGDGDGDGGGDDAAAAGACEDVPQAALDAFDAGLELSSADAGVGTVYQCEWERTFEPAEEGSVMEGSRTVFLQVYEGARYYGEDEWEEIADEVPEPLDICDRAFRSTAIGVTIQVLDGDTVYMVSNLDMFVPDDEVLTDDEVADRLEAFARELTGC